MKLYNVSQHAIERAVERLGVAEQYAKNHLIQLMQSAAYQGDTHAKYGNTKVYCHFKTRTQLVVSEDNTIVTVYKADEPKPPRQTVFMEDIKRLVTRQFRKAEREYKSQFRALEINVAELGVEIAQLRLNFAKAKSPKVRESINKKIDEFNAQVSEIERSITELTDNFSRVKQDAEVYCG